MGESIFKPFLCDAIEPSMLRIEWQKLMRAFKIYLNAEEITDNVRKKKTNYYILEGHNYKR